MKNPTSLKEWQHLQNHQKSIASQRIDQWFAMHPDRFNQFSFSVGEILFDYSKNHITDETLRLLVDLANASDLKNKILALFTGEPINHTEKRSALHTALRNLNPSDPTINLTILEKVQATLKKMHEFTDAVRNKTWKGCTGKAITDIVNIGIGGSHLGSQMTIHALNTYSSDQLQCHFISNIDSLHLDEILKKINPETTLFIISSKTFSTLETLTNAITVREWLRQKLSLNDVSNQFVAVTANTQKAIEFGIPEKQIFTLWEWVGGRYSIWSAVGLPLALMIGMPNFLKFLAGAHDMDKHFQTAPFTENMPVLMALLGIWYINFFSASSHAIIPYSHQLQYLPLYLQQTDMESNGKSAGRSQEVEHSTGPILWGEQGINGQHAFYQLLHQGNHLIPIDFLLVAENAGDFTHQQDMLVASALSQSQALLKGKSYDTVLSELMSSGHPEQDAHSLAHHKVIRGNKPHNLLFIKKINPYNLGELIALYEHKIFVQGAIWGINSFDQWGVEIGKQLLPAILNDLQNSISSSYDASTLGLINHYKKMRTSS